MFTTLEAKFTTWMAGTHFPCCLPGCTEQEAGSGAELGLKASCPDMGGGTVTDTALNPGTSQRLYNAGKDILILSLLFSEHLQQLVDRVFLKFGSCLIANRVTSGLGIVEAKISSYLDGFCPFPRELVVGVICRN